MMEKRLTGCKIRGGKLDKRLEIAYEAGVAALKRQDETLGTLRNRASSVLTAAALVTSVAGGLGLVNSNPSNGATFPRWAGLLLIADLVLVGCFVIAVHWPARDWAFGPDPGLIFDEYNKGSDEDALGKYLIGEMSSAMGENAKKLELRAHLYRVAAGLLVAEVFVFALAMNNLRGGN